MSEPSVHPPSSKPTRSVARAHQKAPPPPPLHVPGQGTEIQFPCNSCNAMLNVPHGLDRFTCPHCGVNIALDGSTSIACRSGSSSPPPQLNKILIRSDVDSTDDSSSDSDDELAEFLIVNMLYDYYQKFK